MQVPLELIFGPLGAIGVLLLWVLDLRKERDDARNRLDRLYDGIMGKAQQ